MVEDNFLYEMNKYIDLIEDIKNFYLHSNSLREFSSQVLGQRAKPFIQMLITNVKNDDANAKDAIKLINKKFIELLKDSLRQEKLTVESQFENKAVDIIIPPKYLICRIFLFKREITYPYLERINKYDSIIEMQDKLSQKKIREQNIINTAIHNPNMFLESDNYSAYFSSIFFNKKKAKKSDQETEKLIKQEQQKREDFINNKNLYLEKYQNIIVISQSLAKFLNSIINFQEVED